MLSAVQIALFFLQFIDEGFFREYNCFTENQGFAHSGSCESDEEVSQFHMHVNALSLRLDEHNFQVLSTAGDMNSLKASCSNLLSFFNRLILMARQVSL